MSFIQTADGAGIFYKDWDRRTRSPSSFIMAGRRAPTTGMRR